MLLILLLMVILLTFMTDTFPTYRNLINIVRQVTFYAIVGYGAMVTLIGGDFDLSPGSVIGLTSILSTMAITGTERGVGLPLLIAVAVDLPSALSTGF